mmetsp:Transcript_914/g.1447  ORF Transcript_914/g.1447 Transcript_914/m.1447 type:complete len:242 (+) Transcript_914:444-1169(+)
MIFPLRRAKDVKRNHATKRSNRGGTDAHYRPVLPVHHAGSADTAWTTVLTNMQQIAASLRRDLKEIVKFLGRELATSATLKDGFRAYMKGHHSIETISYALSVYIDTCVLSPGCKLPETTYCCEGPVLSLSCEVCGRGSALKSDHPIIRFIGESMSNEKSQKIKKKKRSTRETKQVCKKGEEKGFSEYAGIATKSQRQKVKIFWDENIDDPMALELSAKAFRKFLKKRWAPGDILELSKNW